MIEDIRNLKELHKVMIEKLDALEKFGANFKDDNTVVLVLQHTINLFNESQNYYNAFFKKHEVLINSIYGQQQQPQQQETPQEQTATEEPYFEDDKEKTQKETNKEQKQKELNDEHNKRLEDLEIEEQKSVKTVQEEKEDALEKKLKDMKASFKTEDDDYHAQE